MGAGPAPRAWQASRGRPGDAPTVVPRSPSSSSDQGLPGKRRRACAGFVSLASPRPRCDCNSGCSATAEGRRFLFTVTSVSREIACGAGAIGQEPTTCGRRRAGAVTPCRPVEAVVRPSAPPRAIRCSRPRMHPWRRTLGSTRRAVVRSRLLGPISKVGGSAGAPSHLVVRPNPIEEFGVSS